MDEYFKKVYVLEIIKQVRERFENDMRSETNFLKRACIFGHISMAESLEKALSNFPADDVAPVVRCKECQYSYKSWLSDMTGEIWCTFWQKTQRKAWIMMHFDDFCSHGAKKDLEG